MFLKKNLLAMIVFTLLAFTFAAPTASAKGNPYSEIVNHLKTRYQAKKVKVPFMWLARLAVKIARPAGVKSFSVTMFEDLKFSRETLDAEMQTIMQNAFGEEWFPVMRFRSRTGEQAYFYIRESKENVKIWVVTVGKNEAAIVRATVNPDKLTEFIENPKILGISLDDNKKSELNQQELGVNKSN